jgi:formimidoylglutamate deiminase
MQALQADFTLIDGQLRPDIVVRVDGARIGGVDAPPEGRVQRLRGRVLVPGFVNGHSHAFQRLLRGRTEHRPPGIDDDFWSWRDAMYRVANALDPEAMEAVTRLAFVEMLLAGFTHVAEFHYVHHQPDGRPYADRLAMAKAVFAGAANAGIGITLLRTAYARSGPGKPLRPEQRRFADTEPADYAGDLDALSAQPGARVGIAAHSVRALPREWLETLAALPGDHPVHAHVSEQIGDVESCLAEHGMRPVELLDDLGLLSSRFTAVHATHLGPGEAARLGRVGATACICPTTESNLGDGLPDLPALLEAGAALSIGTDSHARIDPFAELRGLEDGERLRTRRRNVLARPGRDTAETLFRAGAEGGARSVGLDAGAIRVGARADLVALRLQDASVAGVGEASDAGRALLAGLWLGGHPRLVSEVWVGGRLVIEDGVHPGWDSALAAYANVARTVWT